MQAVYNPFCLFTCLCLGQQLISHLNAIVISCDLIDLYSRNVPKLYFAIKHVFLKSGCNKVDSLIYISAHNRVIFKSWSHRFSIFIRRNSLVRNSLIPSILVRIQISVFSQLYSLVNTGQQILCFGWLISRKKKLFSYISISASLIVLKSLLEERFRINDLRTA